MPLPPRRWCTAPRRRRPDVPTVLYSLPAPLVAVLTGSGGFSLTAHYHAGITAYRQSPGVPIHRVSALAVVWAVHRWQAVRELLRVCPIPLGGSLFILASSSRLIQPLMPVLLSHGASRTHGRIVSNRRRARDVQPTSTTRLTTAAGSSPTSGFSVSTRAHAAAYSSSPGTWGDDEATGYGPDGWSSVRARTYAATLS